MRHSASDQRAKRRRFARLGVLALALLLSAGVVGCLTYPNSDERFSEEIIYSRYDERIDFGDYKTFAINPEVVVWDEDYGDIEKKDLPAAQAEQLVENVVANMKARGYRQVERDASPDIGITISVLSGTVTSAYVDYWGYYWGYPGYGYYYPYYYAYSYNTGTLIVDAVDLKNAAQPKDDAGVLDDAGGGGAIRPSLKAMWTGLVYGVLSDSKAQNMEDALNGIDQAFEQSPYFTTEE